MADCDQPFHGNRRIEGRKEWVREGVSKNKKEKGPPPETIHLSSTSCPSEKENLQTSLRCVETVSNAKRLGLEAKKQVLGVPKHIGPPLGMNILSSYEVSSNISVGSKISLQALNLPSRCLLDQSKPPLSWNLSYSLPQIIESTPDPLVSFYSLEGSSLGKNCIAYDPRSQVVLADPSTGFGKTSKGYRGRVGGTLSRDQGRKSNLTHAKEKSLFEQVTSKQLSLHGVLRASNPLSVGTL